MSLQLERGILEDDLRRIVQDIFQTMLAMSAELAGETLAEESGTPVVTASMHLGGNWNGAVLLQCGLAAACEFAQALTGIDKAVAAADDDVKDAMGELINMVAGNLKGLLGGAHLSLPTVVEGQDYRFRILRGRTTAQVVFRTPVGLVRVAMVELSEGKAPAGGP